MLPLHATMLLMQMVDISHKTSTLREATATAQVHCHANTIELVQQGQIPKGDVFTFAKSAAFFAAKNTDKLLPHCHPVAIDGMEVNFEVCNDYIKIITSIKSVGKTGIEMEALTATSIAALTVYDMLKPVDNQLKITNLQLEEKKGGKSDKKYFNTPPVCAVLVCSDSTFNGKREDTSGKIITEMLRQHKMEEINYAIVPDEAHAIQAQIKRWVAEGVKYIFTTGGTGLGPRDITTLAVKELLQKEAPGIVQAMFMHGQQRTPLAMMSNMVAGSIDKTMVITLPGSSSGVRECLQAILPAVFHAHKMLLGGGH